MVLSTILMMSGARPISGTSSSPKISPQLSGDDGRGMAINQRKDLTLLKAKAGEEESMERDRTGQSRVPHGKK